MYWHCNTAPRTPVLRCPRPRRPSPLTDGAAPWLQVTRTARMMIEQMGFSSKLGQVAWSGGSGPSFLGAEAGQSADFSQKTRDAIDAEVRLLFICWLVCCLGLPDVCTDKYNELMSSFVLLSLAWRRGRPERRLLAKDTGRDRRRGALALHLLA